MSSDELVLLLVGFLAAGIIGFLLQQVRLIRRGVEGLFAPLTVTLRTEETPAGRFAGCLGNVFGFFVFLAVVAAVVGFLLWWFGVI